MIGDGHAMSVAAEIAQHLHGTTEGGFGIDDPIVAVQAAHEFCKLLRVGQSDGGTSAAELVATMETFGRLLPQKTRPATSSPSSSISSTSSAIKSHQGSDRPYCALPTGSGLSARTSH